MAKKKRKRQRNPKMLGVDLIDFFDDYNDIVFLRYIPGLETEGEPSYPGLVNPLEPYGIVPEIEPIDPLAIYDVNARPRELYIDNSNSEYIELTGIPANAPTVVYSFWSDMDYYVIEKLEDERHRVIELSNYFPFEEGRAMRIAAQEHLHAQLREYYRSKYDNFVNSLKSRSDKYSRRAELLRMMQMRAESLEKALGAQRALFDDSLFRENNPKKGRKRKKNPRRIKNAEVTPTQLTKHFKLPKGTRWARSPVTTQGDWVPIAPDELVRAYPRISTSPYFFQADPDAGIPPDSTPVRFSVTRPRLQAYHREIPSVTFFEEHPTNLNSLSAANYLAPILQRHKTPAAAQKLLDQIPAPHIARALTLAYEGAADPPSLAQRNLYDAIPFARAGYTQSLYGDLLRLEMEGRIARGLGTGYDQTLAKIRDALSRRDEEAMGRILYDLQAYRTPERDDLIDYMNMAAKRSGLNLALASHPFMGFDVARLEDGNRNPLYGLLNDPRHILPRRENPKKKKQRRKSKKKPSSWKP